MASEYQRLTSIGNNQLLVRRGKETPAFAIQVELRIGDVCHVRKLDDGSRRPMTYATLIDRYRKLTPADEFAMRAAYHARWLARHELANLALLVTPPRVPAIETEALTGASAV
jgi:hypothetical protein